MANAKRKATEAKTVRVLKDNDSRITLVNAEAHVTREGTEQHDRRVRVLAAAKKGETVEHFMQNGGDRNALRYAVDRGVVKLGGAQKATARRKTGAKRRA